GTSYTFSVSVSDDLAVATAGLGTGDVVVTGPNSFNQIASFVSVDTSTNGTPRIATYSLVPPGGSWNIDDNGSYAISVQANEVSDTAGNPAAAGNVGSFNVAVPFATLSGGTLTVNGSDGSDPLD